MYSSFCSLLLPSASFSRLSIFNWVSYLIDLNLNVWLLFFLVCVSSFCAFLSFCALSFVGFLSLQKNAIFPLSHFSQLLESPMELMFGSWFGSYAFYCCFNGGIDGVLVFFIWSMYFRYLRKSIECVSFGFCIFITNISLGKWGAVVACSFDSFYLISA